MALGDTERAFIISSGIVLELFSIAYYKLYKKPEVSRSHKVFMLFFSWVGGSRWRIN